MSNRTLATEAGELLLLAVAMTIIWSVFAVVLP